MTQTNGNYGLAELKKEATFGGIGATKARDVPRIDMSDFEARKDEIADQLWKASTEIGFFQLVNHGIPQEQTDEAFAMTERFFALRSDTKAQYPLRQGTNAGWEYRGQVRPSTGTADKRNPTRSRCRAWRALAEGRRVRASRLRARLRARELGARHEGAVLLCAEARLCAGLLHRLPRSAVGRYQSTLRLLHYFPMIDAKPEISPAGAPARIPISIVSRCCISAPARAGLQLCPGKEAGDAELAWTDVEPLPGVVTCNIGDMLMRWSDDKLLSTLHRVRMPRQGRVSGPALFAAVLLSGEQRRGDPGSRQK